MTSGKPRLMAPSLRHRDSLTAMSRAELLSRHTTSGISYGRLLESLKTGDWNEEPILTDDLNYLLR